MAHTDPYWAQVIANESNERLTESTNRWNYDIAHEANEWNWMNAQAQNEWNIQQWQRENEYNDPSAQMQRLIRAGINPIFGMGSIDTGNAQHLESAQVQPAVAAEMKAAHVEPAFDTFSQVRLGNIIAASRDLMNAGQGFKRLGIEEMNAETARASQISQEQLNRASIVEKRAAANALEIESQWKLETFGVRADQEASRLANMRKQLDLMDKQSDLYQSQKHKLDAEETLIREKTGRIAEDYQLQWQQLAVARQQASASMMSAQAQQAQVDLGRENLQFNKQFAEAQVAKWNNEQRLQFLDRFGRTITGQMSASVGIEGLGIQGKAGISEKQAANESILQEVGYQAIKLFAEDPTPENAAVVKKATEVTNEYISAQENEARVAPYRNRNSSNTSVLNPSWYDVPSVDMPGRAAWY